jgi:hypothetical protein
MQGGTVGSSYTQVSVGVFKSTRSSLRRRARCRKLGGACNLPRQVGRRPHDPYPSIHLAQLPYRLITKTYLGDTEDLLIAERRLGPQQHVVLREGNQRLGKPSKKELVKGAHYVHLRRRQRLCREEGRRLVHIQQLLRFNQLVLQVVVVVVAAAVVVVLVAAAIVVARRAAGGGGGRGDGSSDDKREEKEAAKQSAAALLQPSGACALVVGSGRRPVSQSVNQPEPEVAEFETSPPVPWGCRRVCSPA